MTAGIESGDPGTDAKQIALEWLPLRWGYPFTQALRDKIGAGLLDGSLQASMEWIDARTLTITIEGANT